ncbi:endogenous retrovirus group K member 8 Gag polyprotein-like [Passer montanus]|uniref:endogenous retrovirus group K member 8 Gag polyprotein-like n=1 Tax=Passer montanus TaxID=9160 RepID=UPI001961F2C4|nr:endogenous retrovirus group K member 8 Gag polyprotein-like [Passer montanus]
MTPIKSLSFKTAKEVRDTVVQHGVGSAEVMHFLRMLATDVLTPYNTCAMACGLFDPVEFDVFETKWARLAASAVQQNAMLGPQDPRCVIGTDVLLGTGNYVDPQGQAGFNPLMLDQCQTIGIAAMVQTQEMTSPNQPFATVVQGADEPFMKFAGRQIASVERQLADPEARRLVIANLARSNCNADCKIIIEALPGEPTVPEIAEACASIGPSGQKMAPWAMPQGSQRQQGNAQASKKRGKEAQKAKIPMFLCGQCGRPNHMTNVCKATVHINGQSLPGSGNGKRSAKGRHAQAQASLQTPEPMEICSASLQPALAAQQVWTSAQQQQLF